MIRVSGGNMLRGFADFDYDSQPIVARTSMHLR